MLQVTPAILNTYPSDTQENLILKYEKMASSMARRYAKSGGLADDYQSVALIGLIEAARKFDPAKGAAFSTYARFYVQSELGQFYRDNNSIVERPRVAPRLPLLSEDTSLPSASIVCKGFHQASKSHPGDQSLNVPIGEGDSSEIVELIPCDRDDQQDEIEAHEQHLERRRKVRLGLGALGERERHVFQARRLVDEPVGLKDLAATYNVSAERIRQIEVKAYEKFESALAADAILYPQPGICITSKRVGEIRALPDSRDNADNVTRHAITCSFGHDTSPINPQVLSKIEKSLKSAGAESMRRNEYLQRAVANGLSWATRILAARATQKRNEELKAKK